MRLQTTSINKLPRSKTPKTQQVEGFMCLRKPVIFLLVINQDDTVAPAKHSAYLNSLSKIFVLYSL